MGHVTLSQVNEFCSVYARWLQEHAMALDGVSAGTSCVNRSYKVANKNFLFVGEKPNNVVRIMLKLSESLDDARSISQEGLTVGKSGWVTLMTDVELLPREVLGAWIDESYRLFA